MRRQVGSNNSFYDNRTERITENSGSGFRIAENRPLNAMVCPMTANFFHEIPHFPSISAYPRHGQLWL